MAKFVVGVLLGLILGIYLDSAASGGPGQAFSQIQTVITNLASFWR
jgi:F0F1-type ATP synthase assembly protein I